MVVCSFFKEKLGNCASFIDFSFKKKSGMEKLSFFKIANVALSLLMHLIIYYYLFSSYDDALKTIKQEIRGMDSGEVIQTETQETNLKNLQLYLNYAKLEKKRERNSLMLKFMCDEYKLSKAGISFLFFVFTKRWG